MFWTDAAQATERLLGSFVCYDKRPFCFLDIFEKKEKGLTALGSFAGTQGKEEKLSLDDEKWNNFRDLPKLGWCNVIKGSKTFAMFAERKAIRTRTHGISQNNTSTYFFNGNILGRTRGWTVGSVFNNDGYLETYLDSSRFPKASNVVGNLPFMQAVAISPVFCIFRSEEGMRWLYRKKERVGFFTGVQTVSLLPPKAFCREELLECSNFDIPNIQEF